MISSQLQGSQTQVRLKASLATCCRENGLKDMTGSQLRELGHMIRGTHCRKVTATCLLDALFASREMPAPGSCVCGTAARELWPPQQACCAS